jgi:hypothetical protein
MDFCQLIGFLAKHDVGFATAYDDTKNIDIMSLGVNAYEMYKSVIDTGLFTIIRKDDAVIITSPIPAEPTRSNDCELFHIAPQTAPKRTIN